MSAIATVVGLCMASGYFVEGSAVAQVFGFIGTVLTALGYSYSRSIVKSK